MGAAIAKLLFERVEPTTVVWLRLALAACVLLVIAMPRLRDHSGGDWLAVIAYGAALAGLNLSLYEAISRIPLGTAVTIEFLGPLTVATLGSRRLRDWCWIVLAGEVWRSSVRRPATSIWWGWGSHSWRRRRGVPTSC